MPSAESQKIGRPSKDQAIHFAALLIMNHHGLRMMSKEAMDFWGTEPGSAVIYAANHLEREFIRLRGFELYQDPDQHSTYVDCRSFIQTLNSSELISRCFSFEDEMVQGWKRGTLKFPNELKSIHVFLWNSVEDDAVVVLSWHDGKVMSRLRPLSQDLSNLDYALVKTE